MDTLGAVLRAESWRCERLAKCREGLTKANELIRRTHNESARMGRMLLTIPAISLIDIHDALTNVEAL